MGFLKVVLGDFKNISKKKLLVMAVFSISLIPIIYGGFYLAAFWDPYSKTQQVAVGVVNLDSGAEINGKKTNYGNDIVDKLKDNDSLGWHFTNNLEEAEDNLQDEKYYALLVIPRNFSYRLSQVEKGTIKKPELVFSTNKKKNYVVGIITDKASGILKDEIGENIAKNVGVKLYDSMETLKSGMESAASGSGEIKDGIGQMKDQMPTLTDGVSQLFEGSSTLADKLGDASDGALQIKNGLGTLSGKMPDLVSGVGKLYTGSATITDKLGSALDGSDKISDGVGELYDKMPDLASGVSKLYDGSSTLEDGLGTLNGKMPDLVSGVGKLKDGSSQLRDGLSELKDKLAKKQDEITDKVVTEGKKISGAVIPLVKSMENQVELIGKMIDALPQGTSGSEYRQYVQKTLKDTGILLGQLDSALQEMQTSDNIHFEKIQSKIDEAINTLGDIKEDLEPFSSSQNLPESIKQAAKNIQDQISSTINLLQDIKSDINETEDSLDELNTGIKKLYDGSGDLYDGLDELYDKSIDLKSGVRKLYDGSGELKDGIGELNEKVPDLEEGVGKLKDGTSSLSDGIFKLRDGSQSLTSNLGTLNGSAGDMKSGVEKLSDGSTELSDGIFKLSDGASELRDGIKKLRDKLPALEEGVQKLYDGTNTLHEKLSDGADQLKSKLVSGSGKMGDFIASPLKMKENDLYTVNRYGEGLSPYFISLGLWVGALLMFFIITEKPMNDKNDKVGRGSAAFGKYITYSTVGLVQALFLSVAIILLGLRPSNVPVYFAFNIFLSFVFIAIMQNFIFIFGDIGRVISIIALILQLTSSGGTFPGEMLPAVFKTVGPFLPFYYSVSALREIIWGINYTVLFKDIKCLAMFWIIFLTLTIIVKKYFNKYTLNLSMVELSESEPDTEKNPKKEDNDNLFKKLMKRSS